MSDTDTLPVTPGRRVRLAPTPRGFWLTLIGVALAALGPLFGFLIGSALGSTSDDNALLSPLYWGLFAGVIVAGIGVLMAVIGGWRLWHTTRSSKTEPTDEDGTHTTEIDDGPEDSAMAGDRS